MNPDLDLGAKPAKRRKVAASTATQAHGQTEGRKQQPPLIELDTNVDTTRRPSISVVTLDETDSDLEEIGLQRIVEQDEKPARHEVGPSGDDAQRHKGSGEAPATAAQQCYDSLVRNADRGNLVLRFRRPGETPSGSSAPAALGPSAAAASAELPPNPFDRLSDEMLLALFKWLSRHSLSRVAQACKRFGTVVADETFWRRVDLSNRRVPPGTVANMMVRKTSVLRAARTNIVSPLLGGVEAGIIAPLQCKLTILDLSMASIKPQDLSEVASPYNDNNCANYNFYTFSSS